MFRLCAAAGPPASRQRAPAPSADAGPAGSCRPAPARAAGGAAPRRGRRPSSRLPSWPSSSRYSRWSQRTSTSLRRGSIGSASTTASRRAASGRRAAEAAAAGRPGQQRDQAENEGRAPRGSGGSRSGPWPRPARACSRAGRRRRHAGERPPRAAARPAAPAPGGSCRGQAAGFVEQRQQRAAGRRWSAPTTAPERGRPGLASSGSSRPSSAARPGERAPRPAEQIERRASAPPARAAPGRAGRRVIAAGSCSCAIGAVELRQDLGDRGERRRPGSGSRSRACRAAPQGPDRAGPRRRGRGRARRSARRARRGPWRRRAARRRCRDRS